MIICFYLVLPLFFLPADSSSIRDRSFKNDLVPSLSSRLDPFKKDGNSLKIVSNEPFIIQLQMPNSGESTRRGSKEKDTKRKRPTKKRVSKIKPLRKRHRGRRDLQSKELQKRSKKEAEKEKISNLLEITDLSKNTTKNSISRVEILKALSSYSKKSELKKRKEDDENIQHDEESIRETAKHTYNSTPENAIPRFLPSEKAPLVKMVYPSTPKTDRHSHKYTYKDLMADRERLEKKIKYIRNMLNVSSADDLIRVRRRSESDRTANKIAKMFLTLSAVNGLHDRLRPKCDAEDDDENYRVQDVWEKERQDSPSRKSSSSNEERYKVKKWIELMKSKRSSSKTCPCVTKEYDEETDIFPLEQKLPKNYHPFQKGGSSEESSEAYRDPPSVSREKPSRYNHYKRRNHKARDDHENKMKALGGRGNKKFDLPLDDLEVYRSKAKQILQNAEEILDRIKEEEEKRLSAPNIFVNQLKELTSRIQSDPRNNENDLIRKIQKNLGWGPTGKSPDGSEGSNFLENVKSFILDPYEKAKALTDESTKKLSSYLLRNLAELQESGEMKENDEDKEDSNVFFGQIPQKEEEKPFSANLARENYDSLPKSREDLQYWTETVSSPRGGDENKMTDDTSIHQEEQFKKRMQEMIKEQEKKLNEYELTPGSGESSSQESISEVSNKKEKQVKDENVEPKINLKEDEEVAQTEQKRSETINDPENNEAKKESASTKSYFSSKENNGNEEEVSKHLKNGETMKEVLQENDKNIEEEVSPGSVKSESLREDEKESKSASKGVNSLKSNYEKLNDQKEVQEVVAAASEEQENDQKGAINVESENPHDAVFLNSQHIPSKESDDQTFEKIDSEEAKDLGEVKDNEKTFVEAQKNVETKSPSEKYSESENANEALTSANAETVIMGDEESLKKTQSSEEKENSQREEETLKLETPGERQNEVGEENLEMEDREDEIPREDQMSKAAEGNEDEESSDSAAINDENSNEGDNKNEKEVMSNEQTFTPESPSVSESENGQKKENLKKFTKEISEGVLEGEEDSESEKASEVEKKTNFSKITESRESEEMENSSQEGSNPLKGTKNSQSVEDAEGHAKDKTTEMTNALQDEVNEKKENSENTNDTPLKSVKNQSQEKPDKDVDDNNRSAENSGQNENENDENQSSHEEVGNKFLEMANREIKEKGNLESLREKNSKEIISEEKNEENFDEEEEKRLKAEDPTFKSAESEQGSENLKSFAADDPATQEEKPDEEVEETAGNKDKDLLLSTSDLQDSETLKDNTEEERSRNSEEAVNAALENQDQENFNRDDVALEKAKSSELTVSRESLKNEVDGQSETVKSSINDQYDDNEENENDDQLSLREADLDKDGKEMKDESSDDDTSSRVTLNKGDKLALGDADEAEVNLKVVKTDTDMNNKKAEEKENASEGISGDSLMSAIGNVSNEEMLEKADEIPSKVTKAEEDSSGEAEENESTNERISDDSSLRATVNRNEETMEDADETPVSITKLDRNTYREAEENEKADDGTSGDASLGATVNKNDDETREDADGKPLRAAKAEENENKSDISLKAIMDKNKEGNEDTDDEVSLKANLNNDDESVFEGFEETNLRATNRVSDVSNERLANSNDEGAEETLGATATEDGDAPLRFENLRNANQENRNDDGEEILFRTASLEKFSNNIDGDDEHEKKHLQSTMNSKGARLFKEDNKGDSEESLGAANLSDNVSDQIETENDDTLRSANLFDGEREELEGGNELLQQENTSKNSEEAENKTDNESVSAAADPIRRIKSEVNSSDENSSDNQGKRDSQKKSLKVPSSIAQIMKDLEGKEKGDITSIENLNPEKIDRIIDKIDEAEQENKVIDEADCRRECACAENINKRSRNIGRYEIVKDFLHWMKDLKLNRVISDD